MSITTVETRITRQYLERKTKSDLAQMYLDLLDDVSPNKNIQRTNPCPKCGSTLIHKDCGEPYAEIMKRTFPFWQSEDRDDYFYLVRKDELLMAAQEIAIFVATQAVGKV